MRTKQSGRFIIFPPCVAHGSIKNDRNITGGFIRPPVATAGIRLLRSISLRTFNLLGGTSSTSKGPGNRRLAALLHHSLYLHGNDGLRRLDGTLEFPGDPRTGVGSAVGGAETSPQRTRFLRALETAGLGTHVVMQVPASSGRSRGAARRAGIVPTRPLTGVITTTGASCRPIPTVH
jgi:hypothetical protein